MTFVAKDQPSNWRNHSGMLGQTDFDAALEAYLEGGDPEELLQAASMFPEKQYPRPL
jgi:hypothetical protein